MRFVAYQYNITPHTATKETPFYLLFGRIPRLDVEADVGRIELADGFEDRSTTLKRLEIVRKAAAKAALTLHLKNQN